jgi:hypothetical protein
MNQLGKLVAHLVAAKNCSTVSMFSDAESAIPREFAR